MSTRGSNRSVRFNFPDVYLFVVAKQNHLAGDERRVRLAHDATILHVWREISMTTACKIQACDEIERQESDSNHR